MIEKMRETYIFTHKEIEVCVVVNYVDNEVSLVEKDDPTTGKQWLFKRRGYEYMNGWLNILEAMQEAIKDAKKRLEEYREEKDAYIGKLAGVPFFVDKKVVKKVSKKKK